MDAGVPEAAVVPQSKGAIALAELDRLRAEGVRFGVVLADAGYDAEHNHRLCREELGISRSVIALNRRNTGRRWPKTPHRRALRQRFPRVLYHQRWHIEMA